MKSRYTLESGRPIEIHVVSESVPVVENNQLFLEKQAQVHVGLFALGPNDKPTAEELQEITDLLNALMARHGYAAQPGPWNVRRLDPPIDAWLWEGV